MRVAVVGGGIGGLVLGLALREHGIEFKIYEQAEELREIGAAVAIAANATRDLVRLGVGERLEAVSVVPPAFVVRRWDSGEVIADHAIGRDGTYAAAFGARFYGLHRVALLQALADHLGDHHVALGRQCVDLDEHASGVELHLANGETASADVAVGADGVHSRVRAHVAGPTRGRFSGTVGYRGLVPTARMPLLPDPTSLQLWAGPGRHLLHYAIDGGRTVNFLAVVRRSEWTNDSWMEPCPVTDATDAYAGWHPAVTEMVGATETGARWALHELEPLDCWHTDRVVLIGDAAHAMLPHQGQGAGITIEDSIVLADCLAAAPTVTEALQRYDACRRDRATRVQRLARLTADLIHLPDGPDLPRRDAALGNLYSDLAWIHSYDAHAAI